MISQIRRLLPFFPTHSATKKYKKKKSASATERFYFRIWIICLLILLNLFMIGFMAFMNKRIHHAQLANNFQYEYLMPQYPRLITKDLNISAKSAIVFEKDSRVVVYEKEGNFRFAPASTTKIMSALIALEQYDLNQYVQIPYEVQSIVGSQMGLIGGEQIKIIDLIYGMMLPSGNDAAFVISSLDSSGQTGFVNKMNQKAKELRLFNTYFVDPSGYSDLNYTSAFDLARLASYALDNPKFRQIVMTRSTVVYDKSGSNVYPLQNLNKLLENEDVFGIKTGFTNEAGEVLVTSFKSKNKTYIIVVLKSGNRFEDTQQIMTTIKNAVELISY